VQWNGVQDRRLLDIMVSTHSCQATDPIDNVYSMLNMLVLAIGKAPAVLDVQLDYTHSMSTVTEDTTQMLICYVGNLDIFHQVQDRSVVSYDWGKKGCLLCLLDCPLRCTRRAVPSPTA
jgi:Pyruvate/2-oxoacid:ferredoxin oxidoreductase delta subunit